MKRNLLCKVCDVSNLVILKCNFKNCKFGDLLSYLEQRSSPLPSEFSLFMDNDLIFEQGEDLDEDELEDYEAIKELYLETRSQGKRQMDFLITKDDDSSLKIALCHSEELLGTDFFEGSQSQEDEFMKLLEAGNKKRKIRPIK
jgi:hypothetical protein